MTTAAMSNVSVTNNLTGIDAKTLSMFGAGLMLASGLALVLSILVSYPLASEFSIGAQVAGHITTIIAAAFFKLGYVVFAVGRHKRGMDF